MNQTSSSDPWTRRECIQQTGAGVAAAAAFGLPTRATAADSAKKSIGIQVGAVSFVDEGTEALLDILQERGAVNAVFLTTFTYGRGLAGRQIPGPPFQIGRAPG